MKKLNLVLACVMAVGFTAANADEKLVDLVKKVKPSVVLIETFDKGGEPIRQGSGFFISNKGHIITNLHVVENAYWANVKTTAGRNYYVQGMIAKDEEADLAVLLIDLSDSEVAFLELTDVLPSVGEDVVVIGNPLGLEATVSKGIVSAVREIPVFGHIIQISAPISSGSSGSPVVNMKGQVIGVATLILTEGQALNFAVSSEKILTLKKEEKLISLREYANAVTSEETDEAEKLYNAGWQKVFAGEWTEALDYFQLIIQQKPSHEGAHFGIGYVYYKLGLYEEAIEAYKQAIRIKPDYTEAHYYLGLAYVGLGRYQEATEAYKQAIRTEPDYAEAYSGLGLAYAGLDRYQEAIEACKKAIKIKLDCAEAHFGLGVTYHKLGRYQDAIEACKEAIRIKPDFAEAHYYFGLNYVGLGLTYEGPGLTYGAWPYLRRACYQKAIEAYKEAIKIKLDYAEAHLGLGLAYLFIGDKGAAFEQYKILKTIDVEKANVLFNLIYE